MQNMSVDPVKTVTKRKRQGFKGRRVRKVTEAVTRAEAVTLRAVRDMAVLKKMLSWAVDMGKLKDSVARPVKRLKEPNRPFYVVSSAEQDRLLDAAAKMRKAAHLRPIISVALGTGMWLGEILNPEWAHVDFATRTITVVKSKSGKSRSIPMEGGGVVDALHGVQSQLGDSKYVFGDRDGKPMGSIKELMGHASVTTTVRYMHVGEDHKRRAMREAAAKSQLNSDHTVTTAVMAFEKSVITA